MQNDKFQEWFPFEIDNNKIQMFPASIIASIRKDKTSTLLEIPKAEQKEVNINQLLIAISSPSSS